MGKSILLLQNSSPTAVKQFQERLQGFQNFLELFSQKTKKEKNNFLC